MQEIEYFEVESEKRSWSARKTAFCQGNASNKKQRIGNVSVLSASGCHGTLVLREVLLWKAQPTDLWLALKKVIILLPCQVSWAQMFWKKKDIKGRKEVKSTMLAYFLQLLLNYFSGLWRNTSTYRKAWRNEFIPGILFSLQSRFLFVLLEDTLPCELEQTRPQFVDPNSANSPQLSMSQSGKLSFAMKIKPRKSSLDILSIFVFFFWQNPIKSSRKISSWSLFPDW